MQTLSTRRDWLISILIAFLISGSQPYPAFTNPAPLQRGDVFASVSDGLVQHYDRDGNLLETLDTGKGSGVFTTGCAFDSAGNLYVTTFNARDVIRFKGPDDPHTNLGSFGSGYSGSPESIVFDALGNVYVGAVDGDNDIRKFDASGNPVAQFDVATESRGSDWIDLAADQKTMFYTSEGDRILRYDVAANAQLPDFTSSLPGSVAYALRILRDGGVLVADTEIVVRLDSEGNLIQTYDVDGEDSWFSLNLDPDGESFWAGNFNSGRFYKFDIDAGGSPLLMVDTGKGPFHLFGICVFGEITTGLKDSDGDALPDDWEVNGVDTDGDGQRDLILSDLDEVGANVPPNPNHKDIYVWVDWLEKSGQGGHSHRPDEAALLLVKEAFANAPSDVDNPDGQPGINLHIILGSPIEETDGLVVLGNLLEEIGLRFRYISDEFATLKKQHLQAGDSRPGMASVFHYAVFGHYLPEVTLQCPTRTARPVGVAPLIRLIPPTAGSDFIIGHQTLRDQNRLAPMEQAGTFMHELGHTLNLGHGGVNLEGTNYKPNHLRVMNYSFAKGLLFRREGQRRPTRTLLDYSRFGPETIPTLEEDSLIESGGLHGGPAIANYGTIYYHGFDDIGQIVFAANGDIDWNANSTIDQAPVMANVNKDDRVFIPFCQDQFTDLSTSNEWKGLSYKQGEIGKVAALVEHYPSETIVDEPDSADDIFRIVDVLEVDIDIKPGSDPNSINPSSKGTIPVAILSTTAFDSPSEVDQTALTFGRTGDEESPHRRGRGEPNCAAEDVNNDDLLDLVCHFNTQDAGFQEGDTEGILKGITVDGVPVEGRDSVRIVK